MAERVQKTRSTTLFVAFVGDTRFEPADGTAVFASLHSHNEILTGPKVTRISGRLVGLKGDGATRTQQLSGRKT